MAIPFYENDEQQEHHVSEEIDQVDGLVLHSANIAQNQGFNSSQGNQNSLESQAIQQDLIAWKILALAMCKALKDYYQQNMATYLSSPSTTSTTSILPESSTAVIQILPNGQVKPQWN